jgi:hypothetical protein
LAAGDIKCGFDSSQAWAIHPSNCGQAQILDDEQMSGVGREMAIYYRPLALKTIYSKPAVREGKALMAIMLWWLSESWVMGRGTGSILTPAPSCCFALNHV